MNVTVMIPRPLQAACEGRGGDLARLRLELENCDSYGLTALQESREAQRKEKRAPPAQVARHPNLTPVALDDVPELRSAVADAEERVAKHSPVPRKP